MRLAVTPRFLYFTVKIEHLLSVGGGGGGRGEGLGGGEGEGRGRGWKRGRGLHDHMLHTRFLGVVRARLIVAANTTIIVMCHVPWERLQLARHRLRRL